MNIVINEILPDPNFDHDGDGDADAYDEFIELYNPNNVTVSLDGWSIYDSSKTYSLDGYDIDARSYLVLLRRDTKIALGNSGDQVWLNNGTADVDTISFDRSFDNLSIARVPDGGQRISSRCVSTPNSTNGLPPRVVITEVQFDPKGSDTDREWIEILNHEDQFVDTYGWTVSDGEGEPWDLDLENLGPRERVLVHISDGTDTPTGRWMEGVFHLNAGDGGSPLTNTGDDLSILDHDGNVIDYVAWGNSSSIDGPGPYHEWDGTISEEDLFCPEGGSIARVDEWVDTDSVTDWTGKNPWQVTGGWDITSPIGWRIIAPTSDLCSWEMDHVLKMVAIEVLPGHSSTVELEVENVGMVPLELNVNSSSSQGWNISFNPRAGSIEASVQTSDDGRIIIDPCSTMHLDMMVHAPDLNEGPDQRDLEVRMEFKTDLDPPAILPIHASMIGADLTLEVSGWDSPQIIEEGDMIEVKVKVKELGGSSSDGSDVVLRIDEEYQEVDHVSSIGPYGQRTIMFDVPSLGLLGSHNLSLELMRFEGTKWLDKNSSNDRWNGTIIVEPRPMAKGVVITQMLIQPTEGFASEYIIINNSGENQIDLAGWTLSTSTGIIEFPYNTSLVSGKELVVSQDPGETKDVLGSYPDLYWTKYPSWSDDEVEEVEPANAMIRTKGSFSLPNKHGHLTLYDNGGRPIDTIVYGTNDGTVVGWNDEPIGTPRTGHLVKRKQGWMDTNTSTDIDWQFTPKAGCFSLGPVSTTVGSKTKFYQTPLKTITPLRNTIQSAEHRLIGEVYTLTSTELVNELIFALDRGIEVSLLVEGEPVGGISDNEMDALSVLLNNGANISLMTDDGYDRYNFLHSKFLVADGRFCCIGSENWGYAAFGGSNVGWVCEIDDPLIGGSLETLFYEDSEPDRSDVIPFSPIHQWKSLPYSSTFTEGDACIVSSPDASVEIMSTPDPLVSRVLAQIGCATHSIEIEALDMDVEWSDGTSPFIIGLIDAASRNVSVRVLLDGWTADDDIDGNIWTANYLNQKANELSIPLEARIAPRSYLLHNKGMVVDSKKVLVGSMNWVENSALNNREIDVLIEDEAVANEARSMFEDLWDRSVSMTAMDGISSSYGDVLIVGVYYDTVIPYEPDEAVVLYNPTREDLDLSGWSITDATSSNSYSDGSLILGEGTLIEARSEFLISKDHQNVSGLWRREPDLIWSYEENSDEVRVDGDLRLSNYGDQLVVYDREGKVVDAIVWGEASAPSVGWCGEPIPSCSEGRCIWRNRVFSEAPFYLDTDSASDFISPTYVVPGRSHVEPHKSSCNGGLKVYTNPEVGCDPIVDLIKRANETLRISVYQLHSRTITSALVDASKSGVDVKVLLEGTPVGGMGVDGSSCIATLINAGAEVFTIDSNYEIDVMTRYRYLHAKYLIRDGVEVHIGTENLKDSAFPPGKDGGNRGWGILIEDEEVASFFVELFDEDSDLERGDVRKISLTDIDLELGFELENLSEIEKPIDGMETFFGTFNTTAILSPDNSVYNWETIPSLLDSAESEVLIANLQMDPVFFQDPLIRWDSSSTYYLSSDDGSELVMNPVYTALIEAARRGILVKVLLDDSYVGLSDGWDNNDTVKLLEGVSHMEGLELQARLFNSDMEFTKLHTKGIIVDSTQVCVSSINLVEGSAIHNREVGVIIEHEGASRFFRDKFMDDWWRSSGLYADTIGIPSSIHLSVGRSLEIVVPFDLGYLSSGTVLDNIHWEVRGSNISIEIQHRRTHWVNGELVLTWKVIALDGSGQGDIALVHRSASGQFVLLSIPVTIMNKEEMTTSTDNDERSDELMIAPVALGLLFATIILTAITREVYVKIRPKRSSRTSARSYPDTSSSDLPSPHQERPRRRSKGHRGRKVRALEKGRLAGGCDDSSGPS